MADDSTALSVEDEVPAAEPIMTREEDLRDIFREAAPTSPLESENSDIVPEPAPAPTVDANAEKFAKFEQELQTLRDQNVELSTRNNILQSQFNDVRNTPAAPPAPEPPKPGVMQFDAFKAKAATDPLSAIYELVSQNNQLTKAEIESALTGAQGQTTAIIQRQKAFDADRGAALAEFGDLFNSDPRFAQLAGKIYNQLNEHNAPMADGMRWAPGTMYAAAATAYAQMVRAGHINPNPKVVTLRERKPMPQNPLVGSTTASAKQSYAEKFDAKTQAIQRRTAESMGITLERYYKIMEGLEKNDPSFGRG